MTATVTPIRPALTWDAVRQHHDHAMQMAEQTVETFAEIGDMLIALKIETDRGDFVKRCAEAFSKGDMPSHFSDLQLDAAKQRASRYMQLASHREAWQPKHPKTLNDALKMLPKRPREPKPYRESWADVLIRERVIDTVALRGGSEVSVRKKIEKAGIALPAGGYFDNAPDADQFALAYARAFPREETFKHTLTKSDQKKVDRVSSLEIQRLQGLFEKELYAEADRRMPEIAAERERIMEENREETRRYRLLNATTRKTITAEEYRFLLQVLHPDRAPAGREDQYARAFQIVMKLKDYAEA